MRRLFGCNFLAFWWIFFRLSKILCGVYLTILDTKQNAKLYNFKSLTTTISANDQHVFWNKKKLLNLNLKTYEQIIDLWLTINCIVRLTLLIRHSNSKIGDKDLCVQLLVSSNFSIRLDKILTFLNSWRSKQLESIFENKSYD